LPLTSYRSEIDGLRAVSVMGVILFHAGFGFPGGYIGVDVFFVISGYLITSIILRDIQTESFSLINFWVRRIRRIIPAVAVMVIIVLVLGCFLLDTHSLIGLSKSSFAQSFMLSNVYFWRDTGYFAEPANFKPLLHTWTLSVEEQFYIIFPFTILLACRLFKNYVLLILSLAVLASLLLCIYLTPHHQVGSFFLLPTRAWELLTGALLASSQNKIKFTPRVAEITSFAGLVMIFLSMFLYDERTVFPGSKALLPVAGAVAFIAGCKDRITLAGKILSIRPVVFLGVISYSLYLWHWPLFSFAKHLFINVDFALNLTLIFISISLAFLSWKFVETPFRRGTLISSHSSAFRFGFITVVVLAVSSAIIWKLDGIPGRFSPEMLAFQEDFIPRDVSENFSKDEKPKYIGILSDRGRKSVPDFVLVGDSHAKDIIKMMDIRAKEYGLVGEAFLSSARIPIPGLWKPSWAESKNNYYMDQNRKMLQSIIDRKVPNLILVCRWASLCSGRSQLEIKNGRYLTQTLVTDNEKLDASSLSPELASSSVRRQLKNMLDQLSSSKTMVWLLKQVPETNKPHTARYFYLSKRFSFLEKPEMFTISLEDHRRRQRHVENALNGLISPWLTVIDPTPSFFKNEHSRLQVYSDRSHYNDADHLTNYGVELYLGNIFSEIFSEMVRRKQKKLTTESIK